MTLIRILFKCHLDNTSIHNTLSCFLFFLLIMHLYPPLRETSIKPIHPWHLLAVLMMPLSLQNCFAAVRLSVIVIDSGNLVLWVNSILKVSIMRMLIRIVLSGFRLFFIKVHQRYRSTKPTDSYYEAITQHRKKKKKRFLMEPLSWIIKGELIGAQLIK